MKEGEGDGRRRTLLHFQTAHKVTNFVSVDLRAHRLYFLEARTPLEKAERRWARLWKKSRRRLIEQRCLACTYISRALSFWCYRSQPGSLSLSLSLLLLYWSPSVNAGHRKTRSDVLYTRSIVSNKCNFLPSTCKLMFLCAAYKRTRVSWFSLDRYQLIDIARCMRRQKGLNWKYLAH